MSDRPPIMIQCEGSGSPTHALMCGTDGICKMCGQVIGIDVGEVAVPHERPDLMAMIDRGDFG